MTTTIQSTDLIGTGTQFTLALSFDALVVLQGTTIASTDFIGVQGSATNLSLSNHGTIIGANNAVNFNGTGNQIVNGSTGVIANIPGALPQFTVSSHGESTLDNLGEISHVGTGWAVVFRGSGNDITNSGTIGSTGGGVLFGYANGTGTLVNTGTISAGSQGAFQTGVASAGVGITTAGNTVVNSGTISATTSGGIMLYGNVDGSDITNHGLITSSAAVGIDLTGVNTGYGAQVVEIVNTGTISGHMGAIAGGDGTEIVTNRGEIVGDVTLGGGADLFDGRGGAVTGEVSGGEGDDTYIVDDAGLSLVELAAEGTDLVQSLVSWALGDHFENLDLLGADDLNATGNDEFNLLNGNAGANRIQGHNGDDTVNGGFGADTIAGGEQEDLISGESGNDIIWGQAGDDDVSGGNGNDWVAGNAGDDRVVGNDGDDTLVGGQGQDALNGGDGSDVFLYRWAIESPNTPQADRIRGFVQGEDVIDLNGLVDGTLDFIGGSAFSGTGPEVRINVYGGTNSRIRIDVDGDGTADMRIDVIDAIGLTAEAFVL